ncbi:hypothetical protein [Gluconobacter oxydans]|uniref:hypothetical protein n=1 Tax=Gluconobacter oxydans TaxID=442 RepID=UPI0039EAE40A
MSYPYSEELKKMAENSGYKMSETSLSQDFSPVESIQQRWKMLLIRLNSTSEFAKMHNSEKEYSIKKIGDDPISLQISELKLSDDELNNFNLLKDSYTAMVKGDFNPSNEDAINYGFIHANFMRILPGKVTAPPVA